MKVILKQDVKGVGAAGDVLDVSEGYARNFLLKKDVAMIATEFEVQKISSKHKKRVKEKNKQVEKESQIVNVLANKKITISAKVNPSGTLYAAVSAKELSEKIKKSFGLTVEPNNIVIHNPIKELGKHSIEVKYKNNKQTKLFVTIEKKE